MKGVNMQNFESNPYLLSLEIEKLRSLGYDSIRIPGGKSKDGSKYAGVFAFVIDQNTKLQYLVCIPYNSSFHLKEKKRARKNFLSFQDDLEKPEEVAVREFEEETNIAIFPEELILVHRQFVPDNRVSGNKRKLHMKYYFSLKVNDTLSLEYPKNYTENEKTETLGIILVPVNLLHKFLFKKHFQVYEKVF